MDHPNPIYRIGAATVTRIDELRLTGSTPASLYPGARASDWQPQLARFGAGSVAQGDGTLVQNIHSWLVRTPDLVALIDTATGNGKDLPDAPVLDHLDEPFLQRLAAAGVEPDDVDVVLLTHLHADHVGWNTALEGRDWSPVFRRARHVFSGIEDSYGAALDRGEDVDPIALAPELGPMARRPTPRVYAQSVRPIVDAGLAHRIAVDGTEPVPGFAFLPTPGHSIDHASIRLRSGTEEAIFSGDLFHHPVQVHAPDLTSRYCEFPEAARRSRAAMLDAAAASNALVFTSHFAETSAGRVGRDGDGHTWSFV